MIVLFCDSESYLNWNTLDTCRSSSTSLNLILLACKVVQVIVHTSEVHCQNAYRVAHTRHNTL